MKHNWEPIGAESRDMFCCDEAKDKERGCIGHFRGDFGRTGDEFWHSWFDHQSDLKTVKFMEEFNEVVNDLRTDLLTNFATMCKKCTKGMLLEPEYPSYAFKMQTQRYDYYLRCIPHKGDYNFYIYCYERRKKQ